MLFETKKAKKKREEAEAAAAAMREVQIMAIKDIAEYYIPIFKKYINSDPETVNWTEAYQLARRIKNAIFQQAVGCEALGIETYDISNDEDIYIRNSEMSVYKKQVSDWDSIPESNKQYAYANFQNISEWDTFAVSLFYAMRTSIYGMNTFLQRILEN
ncbi:MAG: hypothetical protein E7311_02480 [Clostridiales bacterium]|nr:hypothetical protein [Clostridiales bacterium]